MGFKPVVCCVLARVLKSKQKHNLKRKKKQLLLLFFGQQPQQTSYLLVSKWLGIVDFVWHHSEQPIYECLKFRFCFLFRRRRCVPSRVHLKKLTSVAAKDEEFAACISRVNVAQQLIESKIFFQQIKKNLKMGLILRGESPLVFVL